MIDPGHLKPLVWIGTSRRDLSAMPQAVRSELGYALYVAQLGGTHRKAKPLKGFGGAWVMEIVSDHRGDSYRCVYTVRFAGSVYVLHAFQKKSKRGRETPKAEIPLIKQRFGEAERLARGEQPMTKKKIGFEFGSGNVFADLGLPNADEHLIKAQLVYKIDILMKERKLKQVDAACLFGVKQPDISKMLRGDFRQFSVERLLRFLVALGQDVEIVIKPHRDSRKAAQLRVA